MVGSILVRALGLSAMLADLPTDDELTAMIAEQFEAWHVDPLDSDANPA